MSKEEKERLNTVARMNRLRLIQPDLILLFSSLLFIGLGFCYFGFRFLGCVYMGSILGAALHVLTAKTPVQSLKPVLNGTFIPLFVVTGVALIGMTFGWF